MHLNRGSLCLFFGDKQHEISLKEIKESRFSLNLENITKSLGIAHLIVLDQIHCNQGICVEDIAMPFSKSWFTYQGDFLITQKKDCALVILTADCVPLILYDPKTQTIGAVHAGWKGSAFGVMHNALAAMQNRYGAQVLDIQCFFGPSAKPCCYQVTEEFFDYFKNFDYASKAFTKKNDIFYFDNGLFLREGLKKFGIRPQNIYTEDEFCSICNVRYCSFRRDKELAGRQVTVVALR
ncbi:MAG TPA: polyphenol oxidase family protein [Candidatus Saccharimonadales bacterium]|nr:polyphenol oxidase family protein [Candidatus Saccharimonadales bacterium]